MFIYNYTYYYYFYYIYTKYLIHTYIYIYYVSLRGTTTYIKATHNICAIIIVAIAQRRRVENGILLTLCVVGLSEFVCVCVSRARVCVFFSSTFLHIPTPYVVRAVRAVVVVVVVVDDAAAADNEGTYIIL